MASSVAVLMQPRGPRGVGLAPEHEWSGTSVRFRNPDGSWGAFTNLIGAEGPAGAAQNFGSYAIAQGSVVSAGVNVLRVLGYYAPGGGGAADYMSVEDEPSHPGKLQTDDGRWWEIAEPVLTGRMFGMKGDGATDDDAAFADACAAAGVLQRELKLTSSTYILGGGAEFNGIQSDIVISGQRGRTIIRRKANSVAGLLLNLTGKSRITFRDLVIDGNKANQTVNAVNVYCRDGYGYDFEKVISKNAKGSVGIQFEQTTDRTNASRSSIRGCTITGNDFAGILSLQSGCLDIEGNTINDNGNGVDLFASVPVPPTDSMSYCDITNNIIRNNAGFGLSYGGSSISGGTVDAPIYDDGHVGARGAHIAGNTIEGSATTNYVALFGVSRSAITDNVISGGVAVVGFGAAVLLAGNLCTFTGNVVESDLYGIDAGPTIHCLIADNIIRLGLETSDTGGINLGASQHTKCRNNKIYMGNHVGFGITMPGVDYTQNPLDHGFGSEIVGNTIFFASAGANKLGIGVSRNYGGAKVADNLVVNPTDVFSAYHLDFIGIIENNRTIISGNSFSEAVAAAATTIIPDHAERVIISGSGNIDNVRTRAMDSFYQTVWDVDVADPGSGLTPSIGSAGVGIVTASGGGGSGFAAKLEVNASGAIVGALISNHGSGFTSTPTINISGGGGAGGALNAIVGCNNAHGREVHLFFSGTPTLKHGTGNMSLKGSDFIATAGSSIVLFNYLGQWYEKSRSA